MTRGGSPGSGDGSRPTTDGTVDNIGAGKAFSTDNGKEGEMSKPAPVERLSEKRKNAEATRADGSDAFGLHEDLDTASNKEKPPLPTSTPKQRP